MRSSSRPSLTSPTPLHSGVFRFAGPPRARPDGSPRASKRQALPLQLSLEGELVRSTNADQNSGGKLARRILLLRRNSPGWDAASVCSYVVPGTDRIEARPTHVRRTCSARRCAPRPHRNRCLHRPLRIRAPLTLASTRAAKVVIPRDIGVPARTGLCVLGKRRGICFSAERFAAASRTRHQFCGSRFQPRH